MSDIQLTIENSSDAQITVGSQSDAQIISATSQDMQITVAVPGLQGPAGTAGATGPAGSGVPSGGATNSILAKQSSADYDTAWTSIPTLSGLNVSGVVYINGTDVGGYINGLKLPDFNEVHIVYSGGLVLSASYPSGSPYDYIDVTYSGGDKISEIDYKLGGSSGTTIASYVVTYSGGDVTSIIRTV